MVSKAVCTSLLFATGSLANFGELQQEIPEGLSPACNAAAVNLQETRAWEVAEEQTLGMFSFMCENSLVKDFLGSENVFNVRKCTAGSEFVIVQAREEYAIVAETMVVEQVTRLADGYSQYSAVFYWDGIPRECTSEDYELYENMILSIVREGMTEEFPPAEYEIDVQAYLFANDQGYPANYGAGYQTSMTVEGNSPLETTTWTVECRECSPSWSVAFEAPGAQGFSPDLAIITSFMLNADENFQAAGGIAVYTQLDGNTNSYGEGGDNLNIFLRDDADITIQVDDNPVQSIADFTYDGGDLSNPLSMVGGRAAFDSGSTTDVARPGSGASTAAPAMFVAAIALASSVSSLFF